VLTRILASVLALSLLAATGPAPAIEPARGVQAPAEITLVAGGMPQVVTIDNAAKIPVAVVNTTPALGFWQIVSPSPGKLSFLAFSQTPGTYEVCFLVNGATATEPPAETARTRIVVTGNVPPVPVPPNPNPPTPPAPDDPLYPVLAGIYGGDKLATKADAARKLAAVYSQCAAVTVDDASLKTSADLFGVLSVAGKSVVPLPALQAVRERIATELQTQLGGDAMPLTPEYRAKAKTQFVRMATILKKLAG
jgi:hypothetical protein